MSGANKRLRRELAKIIAPNALPRGIVLHMPDPKSESDFDNISLRVWEMDIQVFDHPLYEGKTFRLRFVFSDNYPIEAPEVIFVLAKDREIPMAAHIYSNGYICLDLLSSEGWSPVHSVESISVSIQSMLASNTKNERPPGDAEFVRTNRQRPRDMRWAFHDDKV